MKLLEQIISQLMLMNSNSAVMDLSVALQMPRQSAQLRETKSMANLATFKSCRRSGSAIAASWLDYVPRGQADEESWTPLVLPFVADCSRLTKMA